MSRPRSLHLKPFQNALTEDSAQEVPDEEEAGMIDSDRPHYWYRQSPLLFL